MTSLQTKELPPHKRGQGFHYCGPSIKQVLGGSQITTVIARRQCLECTFSFLALYPHDPLGGSVVIEQLEIHFKDCNAFRDCANDA